jgi:hypothetical protein
MREELILLGISAGVGVVITLLTIIAKTLFGMRDSVRDLLNDSKNHSTDIHRHSVIIGRHNEDIIKIKERIRLRSSDESYHNEDSAVPS